MTMFANRIEGEPRLVSVGITYGPVEVSLAEDYTQLYHFHSQLGRLLDEIASEAAAPVEES